MTDVVERLRARKGFFSNGGAWMMSAGSDPDCDAGADEIERLRKALVEAADKIERLNAEAAETRRLSLELYTATTGPAVRRAR